jgi:hypothetical protein
MRRIIYPIGLAAVGTMVAVGFFRLQAGTSADVMQAIADGRANPAMISKLRAQGPKALNELFKVREQLESAAAHEQRPDQAEALRQRIAKLDETIDQVGMQRYCSRSRLYWYTDLEEARQAAQASGKPILSLRMLGKLNEDFSCANSRFFRTTLYANEEISNFLRENFILHWKSVRPVPKVTIDFGDGRKLERTLTGNSAHYILTADGDVVDALPGLYGPKAFLEQITKGFGMARRVSALPPSEFPQALAAIHQQRLQELEASWTTDLASAGKAPTPSAQPPAQINTADGQPPSAAAATPIARPKAVIEMPLVRSVVPLATDPTKLDDESVWEAIAALHADDAKLDTASRDLIRRENPTAAQAAPVAITKSWVENPLVRMVRTLESSIAVDTVKNEYRLHRQIHRWLSEYGASAEVESLNERVYAELFLTPSSDPWLGLAPADVYTALPNGGVVRK